MLLVDSVLCLLLPNIEAIGDDFLFDPSPEGKIELEDEPDTKLVLNLLKGDKRPFFSVCVVGD